MSENDELKKQINDLEINTENNEVIDRKLREA